MKEKNITKAYWKIVLDEVKKVSKEDDDIRGHLRFFLWVCCLVIFLAILLWTNVIAINVFESALANVGIEILFIIGPLLISLLSLIRDILKVPAKIYESQGGFLENPFRVEVYKPERRANERENKWVSLQINNMNPSQKC